MPTDIPELKKCMMQRKNICKENAKLIENAHALLAVLREIDLFGDAPTYIGDMYDNIFNIHKQCKGHYSPRNYENDYIEDSAKQMYEDSGWIRAERDGYKKWSENLAKRILEGDLEALEEMLASAYEAIIGHTDKDVVREEIEKGDAEEEGGDEDEFED